MSIRLFSFRLGVGGIDLRPSYVRKPALFEALNGESPDSLMIYNDDGSIVDVIWADLSVTKRTWLNA